MVSTPREQTLQPLQGLRPVLLVLSAVLVTGGLAAHVFQLTSTHSEPLQDEMPPSISTLSALGHVEPMGQVIQLAIPSSAGSSRLEELRVAEGDRVEAGDIVAILDNRDPLQAALLRAQGEQLKAEAALAQVQAGAKQGEIQAQQALITRLEAESTNQIQAQQAIVAQLQAEQNNAQTDLQRYQALFEQGAISAADRDRFALALETAEKQLLQAQAELNRLRTTAQPQLDEARATLDQIQEIRPVDVQVAAAEVAAQQAAVQQAEAELAQTYLRAPLTGQILKIHTYPGEMAGTDGVLEIAQTDQMAVDAEVYESDIGRVQVGQSVKVYADAFSDPLHGTVVQIGLQVERQQVVNTDPSANIDSRVVEVRIVLDPESSERVASLTNLQVTAEIQL